jgi:hypothetical protein
MPKKAGKNKMQTQTMADGKTSKKSVVSQIVERLIEREGGDYLVLNFGGHIIEDVTELDKQEIRQMVVAVLSNAEDLGWKDKEEKYKVLIEALISKSESLMQRTRALDQRLLGKVPEVELGEITRMEVVIQNAKKELEGGQD